MKNKKYSEIHPREIANKSNKQNLLDAIQMSLAVESEAVHRNTKVFNTNRYSATAKLFDYEELKSKARSIKEKAIDDLPNLINQLKNVIEQRSGKFFVAKTPKEATDYIKNICIEKKAKLVVKAKSITSEEIGLNHVLEEAGVQVAETDLAEFILQISKEQPSHNVAPAIHQSRERISKLFKDNFNTDLPLETGEELTKFARDILREKFLSADIGISGANCISADTGSILLVESEGNIRLTTHLPATHIAIAGIEKIIHNYKDLAVFIELLAASGTGQSLTSYTNIITPPLQLPLLNLNGREDTHREFHLVLIDNGRMTMRADPVFHEALYCIRCSACMNVCANFQIVGGHAFGGECYTGGIGGAWTAGTTGDVKNARFADLCTGCSRCIPNCPVQINIPGLNTEIKSRIIKEEGGANFQKQFFGNFSKMAKLASTLPGLANKASEFSLSRKMMEKIIGFDSNRSVPKFSEKTLEKAYKEYRNNNAANSNSEIKAI
ncbi:MAG: lactate utilization protein, partial [Ignavibacteriae bacterium]|nr:lactate utilization protein [Ignavibacteriota bacterium]